MELTALYKRVIGLDIHQAQITACVLAITKKRINLGQVRGTSTGDGGVV